VNTRERGVTEVAQGVYVIRHPDDPTGFPNGNTTVVVGEREVLVVDSCYLPSEARRDIEQIRRWTDKPVRYLVNTHWHGDHQMGNYVYSEAFPQLAVVAHVETRRQIEGYGSSFIARYQKTTADTRARLEAGKAEDGKPLTEEARKELQKNLAAREQVLAEFKDFRVRVPDLSFDQELNIDLGNREVQLKFLGRGNTKGDAVVYLPKERIIIAGDLLDHPVPYLGGGFPSELVKTLQKMSRLDAQTIVPGHGEVLRGEYAGKYLAQVIDFVQAVVAQVSVEVYRRGNGPRNLEAVREAVMKSVDVNAWRQKFAGDDKDNREFFDGFSMPGLVTAAYREAWGN
jgi:glyoxylase-like metal-dependent hydrolase (beta-lactamase superfamily II)